MFTEFLRTWAEIDLDRLSGNLDSAKKRIKDNNIILVLKANAYGHGAVQIARELSGKADYFAVATIEEAVELRKSNITSDILILSPVSDIQLSVAYDYDVQPVIFMLSQAKELSRISLLRGRKARFWLAVDTGMSRIGLPCTDNGISEAFGICSLDNISCSGILTHYACADMGIPELSEAQSGKFDGFISSMKKLGICFPLISASNTASCIDYDEKYNTCRLGISLYGLYPSGLVKKENMPVLPVMSLKTRITYIKTVPENTGISYMHTFITKKPTRIATLSIGYADGVPLSLSNKGKVIINGKFANILGRVCMDQMMVDISDIDNVSVGDTAVIFGSQGDKTISVDEVAMTADTINYDIICRINCRVPRVFIKNGEAVEVFSYISNGIY